MESKKRICVFDFDGTLYRGDSFLTFTLYSLPFFHVVKGIIKASGSLIKWKLGLLDSSIAKEKLFYSLYKGQNIEALNTKAESFADFINRKLNESVFYTLKEALKNGETVLIISASLGFWLRPWAIKQGITNVIATEAECVGGTLTGYFSTPNCKGKEKVRRLLLEYPDRKAYYLSAWGNSDDDSEILNYSDSPHRV